MSSSNKGYKFTITNGVVTAIYEYDHGRFKLEGIDRNETYAFDGVNVTKTEYDDGRLKTSVYSDSNGDGIYYKTTQQITSSTYSENHLYVESHDSSQEHHVGTATSTTVNHIDDDHVDTNPENSTSNSPIFTRDGYQFTVVNGVVTTVSEIERGISHQERIDNNETWSIDGANFVKSEFEHGVIETTTYSDLDGNGIFIKASKSYLTDNGSTWSGHSGTDDNDQWEGTDGQDAYHGGIGNDYLVGGLDNDDLYGGDGDDHLVGNNGADHLYGGDGNDHIQSGRGFDFVEGGIGDDIIQTGRANDTVDGGEGSDSIYGAEGADDLIGGLGSDIFIYQSTDDSGLENLTRDHIKDFEYGDKIDLSRIDAKTGSTNNDAFTFIGIETNLSNANANGAIWVVGDVVYGSTDFDTDAEFSLQLVGVTNINASDFIF